MRLLITFASQASVALQNAFLVEQAGRRRADLQVLSALSELLGQRQDSAALLRAALPLLAAAVQADAGAALLPGRPQPPALYHRDGVAGDQAQALADTEPDGADDPNRLHVPLPSTGDKVTLGMLLFQRPHPFDAHDRQLIATAANLLALRLS